MGVDPASHMKFGTSYDYTVVPAFHYVNVLVRICLLSRALRAVSLGIGHGAYYHEVFVLNKSKPLIEAVKIIGIVFLIDLIGHGIGGIDSIVAHTSLEAGACFLTQDPEKFDFFDEVLNILVHVGETADGPAGEMRGGCSKVAILL